MDQWGIQGARTIGDHLWSTEAGDGSLDRGRPARDAAHRGDPVTPLSRVGVSVARDTVLVSVGVGLTSAGADMPSMPEAFVIACRPGAVDIGG